MFQHLAKCSCTRRATAGLAFGSSLSTPYASRRLYATGTNKDIVNLLNECAQKESDSDTKNPYKIRSFKVAAAAIENLNFKVQDADELRNVKGVGAGIRNRINAFLGREGAGEARRTELFLVGARGRLSAVRKPPPTSSTPKTPQERLKRNEAIKKFMTIPGLGKKSAEALYDAGCETVERLQLKKYKEVLSPGAKRGLKYLKHLESPVPRGNAEAIAEFCRHFVPMDGCEIIIAGDYRRDAPAISGPIELLIIDKSATDSIPTPPHPSTLKPPGPHKPTRTKLPFSCGYYIMNGERAMSVLLNKVIRPLEDLGIVSDTTAPGVNVWQGWLRVPKKGKSWEPRGQRIEGIQKLDGDFHRVNITHIPKESRGSALLALTGDEDYYFDCTRRAVQAGLYLNEWGLWEWEPDSQSISRFQTSDTLPEKTSLGGMWGSETEADGGRWIRLESLEEEQILNAIGGEYVPPNKRNFRFIAGKPNPKKGAVTMKNA